MTVYVTRWFFRWAHKQGLPLHSLCVAVDEMSMGLHDADLGGGLYKKRIPRPGQGKSGGYRTLIATNMEGRWVFLFGFPKSERSNIDEDEAESLKKLATYFLSLTVIEIGKVRNAGELVEVNCNA